jgi:hypothetical protein
MRCCLANLVLVCSDDSITLRIQELKNIDLNQFYVQDKFLANSNKPKDTKKPEDKKAKKAKKNANNSTNIGVNISAVEVPPRWWLMAGTGGTALQARHTDYHMVKLVLAGSCRLTLYSPKHARYLHPFPSIHAANSQSQVNIYDENINTTFPGFKNAEQLSVTLDAGSMIYIPPFWHVHTEDISYNGVSFGVDVLSVSAVQSLLLEAHSTSLPLRGEELDLEKKEHRVIASMVYIVHVLSRVNGIESPRKFAQSLYQARFSQLYPENSLFFMQHRDFVCYQDQQELLQSILDRLDVPYCNQ